MEKPKREFTEKQRAGLAKGRAIRAAKLKAKADALASVLAPAPPPAPEVPAPALAVTPAPTKEKIRKTGGRAWWWIALGIAAAVIDIFIARLYLSNMTNAVLAVAFILFGGAAFLFLFLGLRKRDEGYIIQRPGQGKKVDKANCVNIYYGYDELTSKIYCDCIKFEWFEPEQIVAKHPQKCLDDGKFYYLQVWNPKTKKFMPFVASDTQYYDPKEFVNPLRMPASRKILKPKTKMGEKLRPVLLVIAMGILVFAWIVTTPTAPVPVATPANFVVENK